MSPRSRFQNKALNRNGGRDQLNPGGDYERHSHQNCGIFRHDNKDPYCFAIVVRVGKLTDMIPRPAGRYIAFWKMGVNNSLVLVVGPAVVPMLFGGVQMEKRRSDKC